MAENHLLDVLTREGVLINVSIRYWRATKKLKAEDLGLDPDQITERLISLGHKRLIPSDKLGDFTLIEGRAHALVESNTFPFLNGLGRFLVNNKLSTVTDRLEGLRNEFDTARQSFLAHYESLRVEARKEWREAARKLATDPDRLIATIDMAFPLPERMERYFGFDVNLFQVRAPESLALEAVSIGDQQNIIEARAKAAREAGEQINRGVESFVADCVSSLREQVALLCDEMLASMKTGKTGIHQKTLNRLLGFMDQFKALNFAGDVELNEQLESFKKAFLGNTAEEYRDNDSARRRLTQGIHTLADTARDLLKQDAAEIVARFGQIGRRKFTLAA